MRGNNRLIAKKLGKDARAREQAPHQTAWRKVTVAIVGKQMVGKRSIKQRICEGTFSPEYVVTIAPDFGKKIIPVWSGEEFKRVELRIWNLAGQEQYRRTHPIFLRGADEAIVVFDVTSRASFEAVPEWISEVRQNVPRINITLVANKIDLPDRSVSGEEGLRMADGCGALYRESSAKTGQGIEEIFSEVASRALSEESQSKR